MKTAGTLILSIATLSTAVLLTLMPLTARADEDWVHGRTGLPTVREGGEKVWMERGRVQLKVTGNNLMVTQEFRLHYPGPPLESGLQRIQVAVREDDFRAMDRSAPELTPTDARGFSSFAAYVNGRRINDNIEPWQMNDKKDTATRWHTWYMNFQPGQVRTMRIVSSAPLGHQNGREYVAFVTKDIGHWRDAPDDLEITLSPPGRSETLLADVSPSPKQINRRSVQWVYNKATPKRDVFVLLPADYRGTSR